MSPDPESGSKRWWQTLPGLLTAGAAVITALGGLLVAIHQSGFFDRNPQPPALTQSASRPNEAKGAAVSVTAEDVTARPITLPEITEVASRQTVFKLLSVRLYPYSLDKVSVRFTVRMTNNGDDPANFWAASFRLSTNGSLQSPSNDLNKVVPAHSAQEGDVEFLVPANLSSVGLQMGDVGDGKPSIAIDLQKP
ncbi:MAG: hypothetical protein WBQ94_10875 [Terracidiphilus sp.]